jgi:hypothetical protein
VTKIAQNQLELLRVLKEHGVEFVVVGGVAAQVHGWQGTTADLDIAVARDETNFQRLERALASLGAVAGFPGGLGTPFRTRYGRLEILRRADGVGEYANWLHKASTKELEDGLTIVVAAPDDILRSKEAAGRDKDRDVLPQMREDFRDLGVL